MPTEKRYRKGDTREDGKVFLRYSASCKGGEYWVSPERFAKLNPHPPSGTPRPEPLTIYTNPKLRVRPYRGRVIQKRFDISGDPATGAPTMNPETEPQDLVIIPNFSKYGIAPDGTVYRVLPATRGRTAGLRHRVTPVIHPRGHQWCVQLTGDDGNRQRIPIKRLLLEVFGKETIA